MKLILAPILLSVASASIPSFDLSTSKEVLLPRVMSPIAEEPGRPVSGRPDRPIVVQPEIARQYPDFLRELEVWPARDLGNIYLPSADNAEALFQKPAEDTNGVYIDGDTVIAQFSMDELPGPAHNLIVSGYTTWHAGDNVPHDRDRRRSFTTYRRTTGRTVGNLLESSAAERVQAEFRNPTYQNIHPFEVNIAGALQRAADLLYKRFGLKTAKYTVSQSPRQKRSDRRGLVSNTRTVRRSSSLYDPTAQLQERSGILEQISTSTTNSSSTLDITTQLELYLYELAVVQNNISELLFPFLDTITAKTNNGLVYDVLWLVYQDLTGINNSTGPFKFGLNCLDALEQQSNHTNSTSNSDEEQEYLAVHQVILDIYTYAWTNGSAAANKTGLLNHLDGLSNFLLSLNQTQVPANFLDQATPLYDYTYFKSRNAGGASNATYFNFTLPQWE